MWMVGMDVLLSTVIARYEAIPNWQVGMQDRSVKFGIASYLAMTF